MHKRKFIPLFYPYIPQKAITQVVKLLKDRWIGQGKVVDQFEQELEKVLNLTYAVVVNSSTAALRLALSISGIQPGDEIITTPLTCTLTNHPILEQFAKPIFADIQYDTGNIDTSDIEKRITKKTKAIVCTHWGGTPCDLNQIHQIASENGLVVIEDASEAVGASYKGKNIGTISRFTAFSFQAIQIVTSAEGGALICRSEKDYNLARIQRWFGIDRKNRKPNKVGYYDFDIKTVGFGYHLTNLAAVIGIESLRYLHDSLKHRQEIAEFYSKELKNIQGITLLKTFTDRVPSHHFFTIHVDKREDFCRKLKSFGIETSIVHDRNDVYSVFGGLRKDLPQLDKFSQTYIALPTHMHLTKSDAQYIINVIRSGW